MKPFLPLRAVARASALAFVLVSPLAYGAPAAQLAAGFSPRPAETSPFARRAMVLGAAKAGERIVAVGDRGVVLLSDDAGGTWRQAKSVPVNATLTTVSFVGAQEGWAAGHWGVVLHTADGGETWTQQRIDTLEDRPLFSIHFSDAQHGIAVGLWSLVLRTRDGGKSWQEIELPAAPGQTRADANLMRVFANARGDLFVAGERGTVLRSQDKGDSWMYHATGYRGSFWSGTALGDGTLLVAGMRGTVYRSADNGQSWQRIETGTRSSITDVVELRDKVLGVGLDGVTLESKDRGVTFVARQREDRLSLTAAVPAGMHAVLFSRSGVMGAD